MGARTWCPRGRSGGAERLDAVQLAAEVALLGFEAVMGLEVEPEPVGGPQVAREPQAVRRQWDAGRGSIALIHFGANLGRHGEPVLGHPEAA